ncbi:hypothetical protein NA56DRAFT_747206 [Hyaloscypha hepaticicola]|uniref:Uncharacterized protein n=1 Tax=Hyaloscypha hepaticicola TaxID=2082293 RepID=A0A2J6QAR2_9HELO|nr:hypothetical protein NA56DRAFT_747206 [Hyaloscypha hepaticicola]
MLRLEPRICAFSLHKNPAGLLFQGLSNKRFLLKSSVQFVDVVVSYKSNEVMAINDNAVEQISGPIKSRNWDIALNLHELLDIQFRTLLQSINRRRITASLPTPVWDLHEVLDALLTILTRKTCLAQHYSSRLTCNQLPGLLKALQKQTRTTYHMLNRRQTAVPNVYRAQVRPLGCLDKCYKPLLIQVTVSNRSVAD